MSSDVSGMQKSSHHSKIKKKKVSKLEHSLANGRFTLQIFFFLCFHGSCTAELVFNSVKLWYEMPMPLELFCDNVLSFRTVY